MSGYKHATVTISQEEYRRLHEADVSRKFREYANLKTQNSGMGADVNLLIQQMEDRQQQLEEALALSLSSQNTNPYDEIILRGLLERNSIYYESLAATLQESNLGLQQTIAAVSENFSQAIANEREQHFHSLQALLDHQEAFQQNIYAKEDTARQWLDRCHIMVDFIQHQYEVERFAPGRLNKILRNLNIAAENLNNGFSESCLLSSQENYLELSDLHFELEQLALEWHKEFDKAYGSINLLIEEMDANSQVRALGLQGEELANDVDLTYWSNGKYLQLLRHCRQYTDFMVQDQNRLSIDDLHRIYNEIIPTIRESFESIIYEARINALNSQLRMNIAETALQALEKSGFRLDTAGYVDNDMRADFTAKLDCQDGTVVNIQVIPCEGADRELTNELFVITSHPTLKTEHEARLRWDELHQRLTQFNLRVSRPEVLDSSATQTTGQDGLTQPLEQRFIRSER